MVSKGFAGAPGASESLETISAPPPTMPLRQGKEKGECAALNAYRRTVTSGKTSVHDAGDRE